MSFGDEETDSHMIGGRPFRMPPRIKKVPYGLYMPVGVDWLEIVAMRPARPIYMLLRKPGDYTLSACVGQNSQWVSPVPAACYDMADYDEIMKRSDDMTEEQLAVALSRFNVAFETVPPGIAITMQRKGDVAKPLTGLLMCLEAQS